MNTRTRRTRLLWLPGLIMTALLVGACAGGSVGGDASNDPAVDGLGPPESETGTEQRAATGPAEELADQDAADSGASSARAPGSQVDPTSNTSSTAPRTRAVISTGTVTLQSRDVGQARFDVDKVVVANRGEISDEQTSTDPKGQVERSRMVVRVPSELFDETMEALGRVADLRSAERTSEDVTTQVIDNDVRIRAQEKSLERVETLLARAQTLRNIIWIESQLTRRQADLDSLKSQQAYLADQTTLATITVFLEQTPERPRPPEKEQKKDDAGFLSGLENGWDGLTKVGTAVATAVGTGLPFTVLLLALGIPTWLLARALLRRRQPSPAAPLPAE